MKILPLIFCFLALWYGNFAQAQTILPSTVRQIFSLEQGDSLEYHEWTVATGCGTICDWYELKTVDSIGYSSLQDSMFIYFQTVLIRFDTGAPVQCGQCQQGFILGDICPISTSKWAVTTLDSSIVSYLDTTYQSYFDDVADSSYVNNSVYNGSKQNFYSLINFQINYLRTQEIYVDSIGIIYKSETSNLVNTNSNTEQLIYYHKANGNTWGAPYVVSGIDGIGKEETISVYPNPADDKFIIHADRYQGLYFKLFDALSNPVMGLSLTGNETYVNRNNLPAGTYFWQIATGAGVIKTGKLGMK